MTIRMKTVGLGVATALAVGGITAAPALAQPEFLHEGKEVVAKHFTAKSKTVTARMTVSGTPYQIVCKTDKSEGSLKGKSEVEKVTTKFKECKAKMSSETKECEVKSTSPEGAKEEIITKELKGVLGVVSKTEAESEVGLRLEATTGEVYATITGSTECLPKETGNVTGSVISEVAPVKKLQRTGSFVLATTMGEQMIRKFTGESNIHELEIFGVPAPFEAKAEVEYGETVEVVG
jgi:hypothetical protein